MIQVVTPSSIPVRNPDIVFRQEFDEWAILFDPSTGNAFAINPVSAFIWKNLDGKHNPEELACLVKDEFDEVPENVQEDVLTFIKDMVEKGDVGFEVK
jgi:SynChlorMet cassette protein ScmD